LAGSYYLCRSWEHKLSLKVVARVAIAFGLGFCLSAIIIVPFLEFTYYSHNIHPPGGTMGVQGVPPWHLAASLVVPKFFQIPADRDQLDMPLSRVSSGTTGRSYYRIFPSNG